VAAEAFEIFGAKGDVAAAAQFRTRLLSVGVAVDRSADDLDREATSGAGAPG
jgi:hypothetical protein